MSKRANAKYKIDRRMGESIWGRPKSPVNKRSYGPGQHGQGRTGPAQHTTSGQEPVTAGQRRARPDQPDHDQSQSDESRRAHDHSAGGDHRGQRNSGKPP